MAKETSEEKALRQVNELYKKHVEAGYLWLSKDVVLEYQKKSKELSNSYNYLGGQKRLCEELQHIYGLTEIESFNILNGFNVNDYLNKYERIKNMIPTVCIRNFDKGSDDNDNDYKEKYSE